MKCHNCSGDTKKFGKDRKGNQRYRCLSCNKVMIVLDPKPLGAMRLELGRAVTCLQLLVEGCSIRTIERVTNVHRDTILDLLVLAGERCEQFLEGRIKDMPVFDVQCDEIWGFVKMKEKSKKERGSDNPELGDAYCFVAFERHTKMVLAWHLGRRTQPDTFAFTEKLYRATTGKFQITTDGFSAYTDAVIHSLGGRHVDFAQLIKVYAAPREGEHRYSPAEVIDTTTVVRCGNPAPAFICTSHVERQNLNIRMGMRRMTRLTNAFSKKWSNLKAMYAIYFAFYNFCRVHGSLRVTPAMEAGLTEHVWSLTELLAA